MSELWDEPYRPPSCNDKFNNFCANIGLAGFLLGFLILLFAVGFALFASLSYALAFGGRW